MQIAQEIIPLEDKRKFIKLGKDFFFYEPTENFDPINESKKNLRLFSLNLPVQFSENFLSPESLTIYLLDYLKYLRTKNPQIKFERETVRDQLFRWYLAQEKKEKEGIFAALLKTSKSRNLSFVDEVLMSSFLVGEYNNIKEEELVENVISRAFTYPRHAEVEFLNFALKLSNVFFYIQRKEWELVLDALNEIETESGFSPNAAFYSLQAKLNLHDSEGARIHLDEIIEYDTKRLDFAIKNYNIKLYDTLLYSSFIRHLFSLPEGTLLSNNIFTLNTAVRDNVHMLLEINSSLKTLQQNQYLELKSDEINRKIQFLKSVTNKYVNSKSYLFISSIPSLRQKVYDVTDEVLKNIHERYNNITTESLRRYDEKMQSIQEALGRVEKDKNEVLVKEEKKNQKLMNDFDEKLNDEINYYKEMLDNFDKQPDNSSTSVLKNAFSYNLIFSLFVLLTGGFAEYSNNYLKEIASLAGFLSIVITGGIKWGFISFIVGSIISIFVFINSVYDRFSTKSNISHKIDSLNLEKERAKSAFQVKVEEKRKSIIQRYDKAKEKMNTEIVSLKEAKEEERARVEEEYAKEKSTYTAPLFEILSSR